MNRRKALLALASLVVMPKVLTRLSEDDYANHTFDGLTATEAFVVIAIKSDPFPAAKPEWWGATAARHP